MIGWRARAFRVGRTLLLRGVLLFAAVSAAPALLLGLQNRPLAFGRFVFHPMGAVRLLLALCVVAWVLLDRKSTIALVRRNRWFAGFCVYALLSLMWGGPDSAGEGLRALVHYSIGFGAYFMACALGSRLYDARRFARFILWTSLIMAAVSLGAGGYQSELPEIGYGGDSLDRASRLAGVFASPNVLATQLALPMSLGSALLASRDVSALWRFRAGVTAAVCAYPLFLTLSRSGLIGTGLGFLCALVLTRRWVTLMLTAGGGLAVLQTARGQQFLGGWHEALASGITDLANIPGYQNLYARVEVYWRPAVAALLTPTSIVFGNGAGTAQTWAFSQNGQGLHSETLQTLIDFGVVGLGLLLLGLSVALLRNYRTFRAAGSPIVRALALGGICAELVIVPKLLWDHLLNGANGYLFLAILGLSNGLAIHVGKTTSYAPSACDDPQDSRAEDPAVSSQEYETLHTTPEGS